MNTSNSEHDVVFRALDYISFRWFWIFVNANLVHKFPITDEEFLSGKMHEDVEKIQAHTEENNDCKIKEVKK